MFFDWMTWSIWGIGVLILIIWVIKTIEEFKLLFTGHAKDKENDKII